jgi:hypothetical protein
MGRTLATYNMYLETEWAEWSGFRRALQPTDRAAFDKLFARAKRHVAAGMAAARPVPFEALLVSLLIEHEREIEDLQRQVATLKVARTSRPRELSPAVEVSQSETPLDGYDSGSPGDGTSAPP